MSIHHHNIGNSGHIAQIILIEGEALSTGDWDAVTCKECLAMKPRMMKIHVESCDEPISCSCPEVPVAGW